MTEKILKIGWILCVLLVLVPASVALAGEPIASGESSVDGVTVHVMSLVRRHGVLTLKVAVVNTGDTPARVRFVFSGDSPCYLLDEENGSKYFILTDKDGAPIASDSGWVGDGRGLRETIEPGRTLRMWMKFPAPPPEVKSLTVVLNQTEPIEDVPITDR
jgi:hypothetical protein